MKDIKFYERVSPIKNNFQVKFMEMKNKTGLTPHWHEHLEMLYFLEGQCRCYCDGKRSDVYVGDLLVINSTEIHTFTTDKPVTFYCVLTSPSFWEDIRFSDVILKNRIPADPFVKECMEGIRDNARSNALESDMLVKSYNYRLLAYLVKNYRETDIDKNRLDSDKCAQLDKIFSYIGKHFNEKLTTSQLASMCYLSEGYFCRFFKKATGRTVAEYITEVRVEKASVMLRSTDSTIADIAFNTGFDDANYFARVFRKTTGFSPSCYRKKVDVIDSEE